MITSKIQEVSRQAAVKTHQANIRQNIERRLLIAKAQRNQELVYLLEAEFKQLFPGN